MDLIKFRIFTSLNADTLAEINRGYTSTTRYHASKIETSERTVISLELEKLPVPYFKRWDSDDEELARYQEIATLGYSLAAYEKEQIVGLALCEPRTWNGTLWIWEFHVDESHRRRGIGRRLMEALAEKSRNEGFRALGLETQNTNTPAIAFYRALGFEIEAIDLSFYTNSDVDDGEVAIFMRCKL